MLLAHTSACKNRLLHLKFEGQLLLFFSSVLIYLFFKFGVYCLIIICVIITVFTITINSVNSHLNEFHFFLFIYYFQVAYYVFCLEKPCHIIIFIIF